jgi:hypothetical protein
VSLEIVLFLLRILSASVLLGFVGVLFLLVWRDYRGRARALQASRQSYGRLVVLHYIDNALVSAEEEHPLLPLTRLGRSPTNAVIVRDSFASGEHAQISLRNGQWWLEDLNSRNGTLLNEVPVIQPTIMTDGDVVGIGNLRYKIELDKGGSS